MPISATEQLRTDREEMAGREKFEFMVEDFIECYAPSDLNENARFQAKLHSIYRQMFMDIQKPIQEAVKVAIMSRPSSPIIIKG